MTALLFWEPGKKKIWEESGRQLAGFSFWQIHAQAPGVAGFGNTVFWNRRFRQLTRQGVHQILCGEEPDLWKLAEKYGLGRPPHLPLLRRRAAELAWAYREPGLIPVLYSDRADGLTVETAAGLCDRFPQVELCVGRESRDLAGFLRQEMGAAPLVGESRNGRKLRIFLADPGKDVRMDGKLLDLTRQGLGIPGAVRDAFVTGPGLGTLPAAYQTDMACMLAKNDPSYEKMVKIVKIREKDPQNPNGFAPHALDNGEEYFI